MDGNKVYFLDWYPKVELVVLDIYPDSVEIPQDNSAVERQRTSTVACGPFTLLAIALV